MLRRSFAALAGVFLCGGVHAQTYEAVADWLKLPAGRETLGPMHGDIAVSRAGEVYVSIETEAMGVQVFSPDGRYLRSLDQAPADLHGFVIRDAGDGEHLYGVSLRGQKFVKMTLAGEVVLEIARDAIPRAVLDREPLLDRARRAAVGHGRRAERRALRDRRLLERLRPPLRRGAASTSRPSAAKRRRTASTSCTRSRWTRASIPCASSRRTA